MKQYTCPDHYVPETYGDCDKDRLRMEHARTQERRKQNNAPVVSGAMTSHAINWFFETATGQRCWLCGTPKPEDQDELPRDFRM